MLLYTGTQSNSGNNIHPAMFAKTICRAQELCVKHGEEQPVGNTTGELCVVIQVSPQESKGHLYIMINHILSLSNYTTIS